LEYFISGCAAVIITVFSLSSGRGIRTLGLNIMYIRMSSSSFAECTENNSVYNACFPRRTQEQLISPGESLHAWQWRIHGGGCYSLPNQENYVFKIINFHYQGKIFFNPPSQKKKNPGSATDAWIQGTTVNYADVSSTFFGYHLGSGSLLFLAVLHPITTN
jgi:hypothetical protein